MTSVPSPPGVDLVERRALADDRVDQGFLRVSPPLPFSCACSDVRGVGGRARRREAARVESSMGLPSETKGEKKKKKPRPRGKHVKGTGVRQNEARKRAGMGAKEPAAA